MSETLQIQVSSLDDLKQLLAENPRLKLVETYRLEKYDVDANGERLVEIIEGGDDRPQTITKV